MSKRLKKGSAKSALAGMLAYATAEQMERYEARVVALVMRGHTVRKAETIAAQEIVMGRTPE